MKRLLLHPIVKIVALVLGAYFVMVQIQSYLGRQALAATGLVSLPLDQALAKARAESKLVLVEVSAIWCPSCRRLDKTVFADARVKEVIAGKYVFARLEYESPEGRAFLTTHKFEGFPNLVVLDGGGAVVQHLEITFNPAVFLELLGS